MERIEKFEKYLNDANYIYTKKRGLTNCFKRILLWESASGTTIDKWNRYLLIKFCNEGANISDIQKPKGMSTQELIRLSSKITTSSYFGLYTNILYINEILEYLNREDLKLNIQDIQEETPNKPNMFTKEEIIDICNTLVNAQDRFILYALFSGIRGNKYEDLVNLKTKDINFDTKEIKLPSGRIMIMDEYLEDILRDVTDKEFGSYYYKLNRSGKYDINSFYKFNMDSEYVLKVKPTVTNNHGVGCMSFQGLQTRFKGLSSILDTEILGVNVYRSGVIYKMHEIKQNWVQSEIDAFLKDNGYKLTPYETKRAYDAVYGEIA